MIKKILPFLLSKTFSSENLRFFFSWEEGKIIIFKVKGGKDMTYEWKSVQQYRQKATIQTQATNQTTVSRLTC